MDDRLPPLNSFKVFECVARHMSFSKAAVEMNLTASAISYQVKTLEEQLGVQLFERFNRAIDLTPAGRQLLPGVEAGLEQFREAVARITGKGQDSILVVSTGPAIAAKILAPRIYRFMDAYPEIELRLSASLALVDFNRDEVDLGMRFGPGPYPKLHSESLAREIVFPLCAKRLAEHLQHPRDLEQAPLLHDLAMENIAGTPRWPDWLAAAGLPKADWWRRGTQFSHADHAQNAALEGAGVLLGRSILAAGDMRLGLLHRPFELSLEIPAQYWLVGLEPTYQKDKARKFRDWLHAEMAELAAERNG
ncbi:transcriptional regulator GcvA [Pseudovibrio sp. SPO723]|uniref:transcriptional regulator GcvA n=1 Tax=Nesiotobacter zosterae TaxID=392721 RepID=UPI0029C11B7F|nr:transcriptional regulator GcvA [Pseudovibrio sp. SPO723]MDX5595206.1 transcriptional regulator GcvA [Pseudovibrio sp. SPO723]